MEQIVNGKEHLFWIRYLLSLNQLGYHPSFGARPLRRIQEHIEDPLTDLLLDNSDVQTVYVTIEKEKIVVK